MERPWHSAAATHAFAGIVAICVMVAIIVIALEVRRHRATMRDVLELLGALALSAVVILGVVYAEPLGLSALQKYPPSVRETITLRLSILVFLFWFVFFLAVGVIGASGIAASTAVLGVGSSARRRWWRFLALSPQAYWTVVEHAAELSLFTRLRIFVRHALFGLALVAAAIVGFLIALGLPQWPLVLWLGGAVTFALIVNPHRRDKILAEQLAQGQSAQQSAGS